MQKDLRIKISIDKKTGELKVVESEFDKLNKRVKTASHNTNTFKNDLIGLAKGAVGIYAINEAFKAVIKTGFDYNSQLENAKGGLVALSVAIQDKAIPVTERYTRANAEATKTLQELQKINAATPHTLGQTNQIYKAMYVSMKSVGASTSDLIELTKNISIASGAAGIEFNNLLAGVDGLATGTVLANSDLGRFLKGLGLTNEALKNSKNVTKLLLDKLKDFKAMDTMTVAVPNFTNAWQQMAGDMTKPLFDKTKQDIKDFTKILNNNRNDIVEFGRDTIRVGQLVANGYESIFTASKVGYLEIALEFRQEIDAIDNYVMKTIVETNNYWADSWIGKKAGLSHMDFKASTVDAEALRKKIRESRDELIGLGLNSDKLLKSIQNDTVAQEKFNKTVKDGKEILKKSAVAVKAVVDDGAVKKLQDQLNAEQQAYNHYIEITGTSYDKWLVGANKQMVALAKSGILTDKQLNKAWDTLLKEYKSKTKKATKSIAEETVSLWDTATSSMAQSFDDNFFNFIMGKKGAFKNFFNELAKDAVTPFAHNLSSGVTNSLAGLIGVTTKSTQGFKNAGLSLSNGIWSGSVGGTNVKIDSGGNILQGANAIAKAKSGTNLSSLGSTASNLKSGYGLLTNPSATLLAPSYYVGQGAGLAYGAGFTGTGNFLAGSANVLAGSGVQGLSGSAYAGGLATSGLLGGAAGYAVGNLGDKLLGANTKAGTYGAAGGALGATIGSIVPGIGTLVGGAIGSLLGSAIGGMFGHTSVQGSATGIDVFGNATANYAKGQNWGRTDYHKSSWFGSSEWSDWRYSAFNDKEKNAIKNVIKSYNYLLSQMDVAKKITVKGGRFGSIQNFLDTNVTKSFLKAMGQLPSHYETRIKKVIDESAIKIMGIAVRKYKTVTERVLVQDNSIYKIWVDYAKSIKKQVYEAFASQINQFIQDKRSFSEYALTNRGNDIGALQYKANYLAKDLSSIESSLGVYGLTVNNFTSRFDAAFKHTMTPQTLKDWENLGNALRASNDASVALAKAQAAKAAQDKALQVAKAQAIADAIIKANSLAFDQAKFADSITGTKTALAFAENQVQGFNGSLPTTANGLISLRQNFLNSGQVIDKYEQAIMDATLKTRPFIYAINNIAMSFEKATTVMENSIVNSTNAIQTLLKYGRDVKPL